MFSILFYKYLMWWLACGDTGMARDEVEGVPVAEHRACLPVRVPPGRGRVQGADERGISVGVLTRC